MSSNNKSAVTLVLVVLLFVIIAGLSWVFFSKKNQDMDASTVQTGEMLDDGTIDTDAHADGHDSTVAATDNGEIGVKGKIHTLTPPAIYGVRASGDPSAPVKIQEFFSLTCNHCADFYKGPYQDIKKNLIDTGKVYFVYEEFPLNGPALYGSMIARCLPEERYTGFMDILFRNQDDWAFSGDFKSALMQNAKLAGMSEEEFETCFNNKNLQQAVATNIKEASDVWKINSTPSFVVNDGERILYGGQSYETFQKLVDQLMGTTTPVVAPDSSSTETDVAPAPMMDETPAPAETTTPSLSPEIKEDIQEMEKKVDDIGDEIQDVIEKNTDTLEDKMEAEPTVPVTE